MERPSCGWVTESYSKQIEWLKKVLHNTDAVVIGVGAGLSTSAASCTQGSGLRSISRILKPHDIYSGAYCHYDAPEEHWAYWNRFITVNRIDRCFESSEGLTSQFGYNRGLVIAYYLTEIWAEFSSFLPELYKDNKKGRKLFDFDDQ